MLALVVTTLAFAWASSTPAAPFHASLDELLAEYVSDGYVDYPGIAADARFGRYVERLRELPPEGLTPAGELAYWINAYNALSIKGILDGHSPVSLFGRLKFFKRIDYAAGGRTLDLYALERDVIIPFGDPRIHFAIVCASASCPALRDEAYAGETLEAQLEAQARAFINDSAKNSFDRERKLARLSKIFAWYEDEFVREAGSVAEYIARYVSDEELARALRSGEYRIKHMKYDWSLNGKPPS